MDLQPKQFVRVNVKAATGGGVERVFERTFSVDPRTITLDRLRHLIARALNIREEFSMVALRSKTNLPLSCDWDLEGALSEEPNMDLMLELQPNEPGLEEWDIICSADVPVAGHEASVPTKQRTGSFLEQIFLRVRSPPSPYVPLSESEFEALCDWPSPLRYAVYRAGGAEEGVRPRLWMHLLDVYPTGAGREERAEFLNRKSEEYYRLRHSWQRLVQEGTVPDILAEVTCLIRKDVKRTDRVQALDERALYNVLTTYAAHHPSLGYCQGMSDLLSPLLRVMGSEARAYVAFCALMRRMQDNFRPDGRSVCAKFRHLRAAIRAHDPQLHEYLKGVGAIDLIYCYRWLLLDLKREFPYEEMLRLQEVLWSTFRPIECEEGVELYEEPFPAPSVWEALKKQTMVFAEDHFGSPKQTAPDTLTSLKRWAVLSRRQSIARNIENSSTSCSSSSSSSTEDEDGGIVHYRQYRRTRRRKRRRSECRSWSGRDSSLRSPCFYSNTVHEIRIDSWIKEDGASARRRHGSSDSNYESNLSEEDEEESPSRGRSEGYTSGQGFEDEDSSSYDSADTYFNGRQRALPLLASPTRLFDGKPFLAFLCLQMILGHRDAILGQKLDANEIGMYFDRLVRGHRLADVLPAAKALFEEYLRSGWTEEEDS